VAYYEAMGFVDDPMATAHVWYRALNCGFRLPAGAGTDAMANFASLRGPVGMNRVYVHTGGAAVGQRVLLDSLLAGRTFVTNGPMLELSVGGRGPGQELRLPAAARDVEARVRLWSNVPVDHLEIVSNGQVVAEISTAANHTHADTTLRLPLEGSAWFLLRARTDRAVYPVLDLYPYATTSPVYVVRDGAPIRSAEDAEYFLRWIDRLAAFAAGSKDWNSAAEREGVLELIRRAKEEFERRR
jgi:hypothetical protein